MTFVNQTVALLLKCETQFRAYEANHRTKASRAKTPKLRDHALEKAEVNRALADEINELLDVR